MQSTDIVEEQCFTELARYYTKEEADILEEAINTAALSPADREQISTNAEEIINDMRVNLKRLDLVEALLQEYGLSTEEGVVLMRLAEALLRTPDFTTSRILVRDKFANVDWARHAGKSPSALVNQATNGLRLSSFWIKNSGGIAAENLLARLGDTVLLSAVKHTMKLLGEHFVLGRSIKEASENANKLGEACAKQSYDMLGEAAYTKDDAERYFNAYLDAARYLANTNNKQVSINEAPSLSVKLSALHTRYEFAQRERCLPSLFEKIKVLAAIAKDAGFGLTIDAEEADRLETSLLLFQQLLREESLSDWGGLGIVVQAYQRRSLPVLQKLIKETRLTKRYIAVRLVKGAYWDMEIKRAQELGLKSYPVFTRKENTDASYLACARVLLSAQDCCFPQFATHNAHTAAAINHMANDSQQYEFQRLHGMGEELHEILTKRTEKSCRVYAPVGNHKDLLPYLVRRLLENGANSSFVNQILDSTVDSVSLSGDPITKVQENTEKPHPKITEPRSLFQGHRLSALGHDLTQEKVAAKMQKIATSERTYNATSIIDGNHVGEKTISIVNPANNEIITGTVKTIDTNYIDAAVTSAIGSSWRHDMSAQDRANCLSTFADKLEQQFEEFLHLCVHEAGKTLPDAVDEIREAVDFCRYYAFEAQKPRLTSRDPLGVIACISPWNFPLAIFLGQIVASLSVGNTVIAKPAEQTPLIAYRAVKLLQSSGVPADAVQLLIGDGAVLGTALTKHEDVSGICFTGSTATAKRIASNLAETNRATTPFIAETGGINAMIVDSTALLEQAVEDVVTSAFQSAGQRCSACRIVCVQEDIADAFTKMLEGAMQELSVGDQQKLSTDVGPVIDAAAFKGIHTYIESAKTHLKVLAETATNKANGKNQFIAPIAFEITNISDVKKEIFGPVLHMAKFKAGDFEKTISQINALGFGLTIGLHTRIDSRIERMRRQVKIGNLYVNRNQIGAIVGVQPFGGEGLSGTGPKAGGPHYLLQLTKSPAAPNYNDTEEGQKLQIKNPTQGAENTKQFLENAKKAARAWADGFSSDERIQIVTNAIQKAFPDTRHDFTRVTPDTFIQLPGPTGEENTLTLYPRGVLLSFSADTEQILTKQILLALSTGNGLIIGESSATEKSTESLKVLIKELPSGLLKLAPFDTAIALIEGDIEGLIVDGALRPQIATLATRRQGPILPLLTAFDEPERFYHERTMTIDKTAAGGNASLLAMT